MHISYVGMRYFTGEGRGTQLVCGYVLDWGRGRGVHSRYVGMYLTGEGERGAQQVCGYVLDWGRGRGYTTGMWVCT